MSSADGCWVELRFRPLSTDYERTVQRVVAPLLAAARTGRIAERGLFLRELAPAEHTDLIVQLGPCGRQDARGRAVERVRALVNSLDGVRDSPVCSIAAAETVPLAGPVFGGTRLGSVSRDFLAEVTPILLELLDAEGTARLSGALDVLVGHLIAASGAGAPGAQRWAGVPLSFLSLRSHVEAFFLSSRDPEAARQAMEQRYLAVREHVLDRVRTLLAQGADDLPVVSASAAGWQRAVGQRKAELTRLFRTGQLTADSGAAEEMRNAPDAFRGNDFHTAVGSSAGLQHFLHDDPAFATVRLLGSLLYRGLHNVGIPLAQRYFLCHAVSRACEEVFDVDAVQLIHELAAQPI